MKRLPSQYSTEELMKLLEVVKDDVVADEEVRMTQSNDILAFTSNYRITPGSTPVSKKLLYKLYQTFSSQPYTQAEFTTRLKEFVDDQGGPYFYINQDQFAISKYIYKESKKRDIAKSAAYQRHFNWFLETKKVEPGSKWLEGFVLFYLYRECCRERKVKPKLGYKNFHNFLKLHFKFRRVNGNRSLWFSVDEKTFESISETEKEVLRNSRKK